MDLGLVLPACVLLPQGSDLLRDPSLGVQVQVYLVKLLILTEPEVGSKLGSRPESELPLHLHPPEEPVGLAVLGWSARWAGSDYFRKAQFPISHGGWQWGCYETGQ